MHVKSDAFAGRRRFHREDAVASPLRRLLGDTGPRPPWDDSAPIRAELFSVERLEEHARSLAAAQAVTPGERKGASLVKRLAENEAVLVAAYRDIAEAVDAGAAITPAAEWLIDNYHVVEEQIREVRGDLPPGYYRQLPKLAGGAVRRYPRVFGVAWAYVAHTDSRFDPDVLRRYLRAYQEIQPLTIGELWAVAITLRIVLVENLRRIAKRIIDSRTGRRTADLVADRLLGGRRPRGEPAETVLPPDTQATFSPVFSSSWCIGCATRIPASRRPWHGSTGNWSDRGPPPRPLSVTSTSGRSREASRFETSSPACVSSPTSIGRSCSSASA